ncbi:hypothetical protein GCM10011352_17560 [Marinobacterium zhoushanense]|uniref:Leucine rich repeat (LRR) protein n=1 Tax=Marinobacterium zhoushanense TaxID=1679163 RepID=A0ABQ1K9L6_9GAMM|nr:hypothetical protein [Marinobacterium zhoushanense]GGB91980.1 hypothetical protein GCM10011352_17560 [Marinobacterium zhoushanense]
MKVAEIPFEDDAFKQCVLDTKAENAEEVTRLICRKKQIKSLAGIEYLTALRVLDVTRNQLTRLHLSKNTQLTDLFAGNNEISELDISNCTQLETLELFTNNLEVIDLSNNPMLEEFFASDNDLSSIRLSANTELRKVRLSGNNISTLELPSPCMLQELELKENPLPDALLAQLQALPDTQVRL